MSKQINLGAGLEHVRITERQLLDRLFCGIKKRRGESFWYAVRQATGHGSNVSIALCQEFGRDPETGERIGGAA